MSDNTQEKNYVGSLLDVSVEHNGETYNFLHTIMSQTGDSVKVVRMTNNKEFEIPVCVLEGNKLFKVL